MATYIAFLRAINLGAKRQFPKAAIVAATEAAGFTGAATHINTGNVRLETTLRSRAKIEAALEAAYLADRGFEVPTIAFTCAEVVTIVEDAERFGAGREGRHYVSLLKDQPTSAVASAMEDRSTDDEQVRVSGRAVHLMLGENYHEAKLTNAGVEKVLGVATNRNLTVLRALVAKWC
ncbi:MAG: DUF1697 domain-containing protein [Nocardioides sp.]